MTGWPDPDDPESMLAAEYAVGALDGEARRAAEQRMAADPAFRAEVEDWSRRLAPMLDEIAPTPAPKRLWRRVRRRIEAESRDSGGRLWTNLRFWRGLAIAMSGVVATAALALALLVDRPQQPALMVAPLAAEGAGPGFLVGYDRNRGEMIVHAIGDAQPSRQPELWLIDDDGAPRSLGVLDATGRAVRAVPAELRDSLTSGRTLAVSLEPVGGSPIGSPTGPVIAVGALRFY